MYTNIWYESDAACVQNMQQFILWDEMPDALFLKTTINIFSFQRHCPTNWSHLHRNKSVFFYKSFQITLCCPCESKPLFSASSWWSVICELDWLPAFSSRCELQRAGIWKGFLMHSDFVWIQCILGGRQPQVDHFVTTWCRHYFLFPNKHFLEQKR